LDALYIGCHSALKTLWYPEDGLQVSYSADGTGRNFRPIEQASPGQKTAAILAFVLAYGTEPLVLDQPEDDLDNRLIYDLIVKQIRQIKTRRQVIVVTHNPNIVVNGDAEKVLEMAFKNGQCVVGERGSLQSQEIRDAVCRVMEGGPEAFKKRYKRIALEKLGS
jgi:energy-coupling factor transporter ATP-binding protein EcfA2